MFFNKTKKPDMIDVRELQKRGVVKIPKSEINIPTNNDGFVELKQTQQPKQNTEQSNSEFFGFMNTPDPIKPKETFSTEPDGYNKREVDQKTTNLDNKIYKLEQRIELIEKKLNVSQPSNPNPIGW